MKTMTSAILGTIATFAIPIYNASRFFLPSRVSQVSKKSHLPLTDPIQKIVKSVLETPPYNALLEKQRSLPSERDYVPKTGGNLLSKLFYSIYDRIVPSQNLTKAGVDEVIQEDFKIVIIDPKEADWVETSWGQSPNHRGTCYFGLSPRTTKEMRSFAIHSLMYKALEGLEWKKKAILTAVSWTAAIYLHASSESSSLSDKDTERNVLYLLGIQTILNAALTFYTSVTTDWFAIGKTCTNKKTFLQAASYSREMATHRNLPFLDRSSYADSEKSILYAVRKYQLK